MNNNNRMLLKSMMYLQLFSLSLILTVVNSEGGTTPEIYLQFKVRGYNIYFDKGNATEFFSCLCEGGTSCTLSGKQMDNRVDVDNTDFDYINSSVLSNVSNQCSLYINNGIFINILCYKTPFNNYPFLNPKVIQLNNTECDNFFNKVSCDTKNVSLTWMECDYSVMCFANNVTVLSETHTNPDLKCNISNGYENISKPTKYSILPNESTTNSFQKSSNGSDVLNYNFDTNVTLIIAISVSVGAALTILFIAATILLYRRKKQAKLKSSSFQHRLDSDKSLTNGYNDKCDNTKTPRVIEPYSVVTLNIYTTTDGISNPRKRGIIIDGNTNSNHHFAPTMFSETEDECGLNVNQCSDMASTKLKLKQDKAYESLGPAFSKLDESAKSDQDQINNLQEVRPLTLSELYSNDNTSDNIIRGKEHIYFELEQESINESQQENHIHH